MADILQFKANLKTYQRQRTYREAERLRLMAKIGINPEDAPLYSEELRFLAYQASLPKQAIETIKSTPNRPTSGIR